MNIREAANLIGCCTEAIRRRVIGDTIRAEKIPTPQGFRFELLDDDVRKVQKLWQSKKSNRGRGYMPGETLELVLLGHSDEYIRLRTGIKLRSIAAARRRLEKSKSNDSTTTRAIRVPAQSEHWLKDGFGEIIRQTAGELCKSEHFEQHPLRNANGSLKSYKPLTDKKREKTEKHV